MPNQTITAQQANYKSADPVADYFLTAINGKAGEFMSNLKLQKLCYLAQGWHLAYLDKPLFDDEIEAWAHGPVVVELYRRFKKYKWQPIDIFDQKCNPYEYLEDESLELLNDLWNHYGLWGAKQLEALTHDQKPWRDAYGKRNLGASCNEVITHQAMKDYFLSIKPA